MAVVNTTYNFNQPNMNFGQAMLCGAFGSLTGGYGMGMGGSLFSMMGMGMGGYGCGFGGYGIGGYTDSYAGMQIGNAFAGIIMNTAAMALSGRGGNGGGSEKVTKTDADYNKKEAEEQIGAAEDKKIQDAKVNAANIKGVSKDIVDGYSKLKVYNETLAKEDTELPVLISDTNLAKAKHESAKKELEDLNNATPKDNIKIAEKEKEIATLYKNFKDAELAQKKLEEEINKAKAEQPKLVDDINKMTDKIKAILPNLNIDENTTQAEIDNAADKLVTDAEKAKSEAIDKLAKELKEADEADAKKQADRARLEDDINKVDGNSVTRTKASKVKEKDPKDYDEDDVQGALAAFKNAKSDNDKKYWHGILHKMCQNNDLMNSINSNIAKIVKKYFSEDYKAE